MNTTRFIFRLGLLSALTSPLIAQEKLEDLNSGVLLKKAIEAFSDEKYDVAAELLRKIPEGDTNYNVAQYELALALLTDSQYDKSIAINKMLLAHYPEEERQVLLNIGTALSYKGASQDALAYYDTAHQRFPTDNRPLYETGVVHMRNDNLDEAIKYFKRSLMLEPRHFRSHYLLGVAYLTQGRLSEAYISTQASLMFTSNANEAQSVLNVLHTIAVQGDLAADAYRKKDRKYQHQLFDEIDELISSKLALSKEYKIPSKFDNEIVRQLSVIFEKLEYDAKDDNFVMQYYVPLLLELKKKNVFDAYILYLLSDYGIEEIEKVAGSKRGKNKITEINQIINPYFNFILGTQELFYTQRSFEKIKYFTFPEEGIRVEGKPKDISFAAPGDGYMKYYKYHKLVAEGELNASGEKEGVWKYYYGNGKLRSEETNKGGKSNFGTYKKYFENGNLDYEVSYTADGEFKERKDYKHNGMPYSIRKKQANGEIKVVYFHKNGKEIYSQTMSANDAKEQVDGPVKVYFMNGKLQIEYEMKNGVRDGLYKEYYENGRPKYEISYKNGEYHGSYLTYYNNGQLSEKYLYENGKLNGKAEDYHLNGDLYLTQEFKNGSLNGTVLYYNKNKEKFGEIKYQKGIPYETYYTDLKGTLIANKKAENGLRTLELYDEYGIMKNSITLDQEGKKEGAFEGYFPHGTISQSEHFVEAKKSGVAKYYFENGVLSHSRTFIEGVQNGKYEGFTEAGKKDIEGWYVNDDQEGPWYSYYSNGKVRRAYFMLLGQKNGPERIYDPLGDLIQENRYEEDMLVGIAEYDRNGKLYNKQDLPQGEGILTRKYPNGDTRETVPLKYGLNHGVYNAYALDKTLTETGTYEFGDIQGLYQLFHPNGNLYFEGKYVDGYREGLFTTYDPAGNKIDETNYENGKRSGISKTYCGNALRYQFEYINDKKHGKCYFYGESDKIAGILHFDKGSAIGYSYIDKSGNEIEMIPIEKGTAKISTFYASGEKGLIFELLNNGYDGSQKLYYSNGTLAEDRNFKDGMFHGSYKKWNSDGSALYEVLYDLDLMEGTEKQFDAKGKLLAQTPYKAGIKHGQATIISKNGDMKAMRYHYGTFTE